MNLTNRLFVLLLAVCLLAAVPLAVGCGEDESDPVSSASPSESTQTEQSVSSDAESASSEGTVTLPLQTQAEKLYGEWEATWELSDFLNSVIAYGDEALGSYLRVTGFAFPVRFAFREDGTYDFSPDADSLDAALSSVREQFRAGYTRYFLDSAEGYDITVEDILSSIGYRSMDEYLDDVMSGFDQLSGSLRSSGNWFVSGEKLYLQDGEGVAEDGRHAVYTLEGDTLTIREWAVASVEGIGGDDEAFLRELYGKLFPLPFSRVS